MARQQHPEKNPVTSRLSEDDWIEAGYALLAEEGINALKLDRLCGRLGVTKGSFYWHFDNMATFRRQLVQTWAELRDRDSGKSTALTDVPPRERLSRMMIALVSPRQWTLERAMREWARTDRTVAASVRTADRRVFDAVRRAFVDYGFDAEEADLRASATFAAGIGFLHLSGAEPGPLSTSQRERFLDLMLRR